MQSYLTVPIPFRLKKKKKTVKILENDFMYSATSVTTFYDKPS